MLFISRQSCLVRREGRSSRVPQYSGLLAFMPEPGSFTCPPITVPCGQGEALPHSTEPATPSQRSTTTVDHMALARHAPYHAHTKKRGTPEKAAPRFATLSLYLTKEDRASELIQINVILTSWKLNPIGCWIFIVFLSGKKALLALA
jgi:hypothetical protein